MKRQTDKWFIGYVSEFGCFYLDLVYYLPIWLRMPEPSYRALNELWEKGIELGCISGDLNNDGDLDDAGEACIGTTEQKNKLLELAGISCIYEGTKSVDYKIKEDEYAIAEMFNAATGYIHFVVIDHKRNIVYDSIKNSVTARDGKIISIRIIRRIKVK